MEKILGLDLGTNSIGLSVRNLDNGTQIKQQLEYFTTTIFSSGVGKNEKGEFSYAAERTQYRSARRLYQSRKYRLWATLKLLIENDYCPLSMKDLEKWSKYDKAKGLKREYPIEATEFEQWIRLDFNGDGKPEYSSPYQLRAELTEKQLDFSNQADRYKLGRALYHIAQRRGFKSSKGSSLKELDSDDNNDFPELLQKSEEKKSSEIKKYMEDNDYKTIGYALWNLEKSGKRLRNSIYTAVRSQYKDEIKYIFDYQKGIDINSNFCKRILSEKKGEGTIFYKRPLHSQKGSVGKCTLETNKKRCPVTHPSFEKFRAWCFINTIRYKEEQNAEFQPLSLNIKRALYDEVFMKYKSDFDFRHIREWLQRQLQLSRELSYADKTINYEDRRKVASCVISSRLKDLLGEKWETVSINTNRTRTNTGRNISYNYKSIWNLCYSSEEMEFVADFAKTKLGFSDDKQKILTQIWGNIARQQGYSSLSVKAIDNINRFLEKGLMYTDAVLLAKLPDIFGTQWTIDLENELVSAISGLIDKNRTDKTVYGMANTLIANYKSLGYNEETGINERFAEHNYNYRLDDSDYRNIEKCVREGLKNKNISDVEYQQIFNSVADLYQDFFASKTRDYYRLPKISDSLSEYLKESHPEIGQEKLNKIYHPSMIAIYKPADYTTLKDGREMRLLGSPVTGAFKNPMAMRVLHSLRRKINRLLINGIIDEDTRIVVETARELNDANMRWAINKYQTSKEEQNRKIKSILQEHYGSVSDNDIDKAKLLLEQNEQYNEITLKQPDKKSTESDDYIKINEKLIQKYKLWLEQGCRSIYTGNIISLSDLFDGNRFNIEHTIPRSISFDDSLTNKTICESDFNTNVKKTKIPSQLDNYDEILRRIQPWIDKVDLIKSKIEFWKYKSKVAGDKTSKDNAIRQRHLWEFELDYWGKKVATFTTKEVDKTFRNNQLNDTRIITKYAYHYLKTVFNNVDVQKGNVTALFRKIAGIQATDETKDRSMHSHHAIDATILTLIPSAVNRDKMIELFYQLLEAKNNANIDKTNIERELSVLKNRYIPKDVSSVVQFINDNIFIDHVKRDNALTPAKRIVHVKKGKDIILTGDCIRGQIHEETFYGAIKCFERDKDGNITTDKNGKPVQETKYVVRRELEGFKNWNDLEKAIVNKRLIPMMKQQYPGESFEQAQKNGIYMLDKNGNKVNQIRHVRCFASKISNPLTIKKQTYTSKCEHKNYYYAGMGDLFALCKYVNKENQKIEYQVISLYDVVQFGLEDIPTCIDIENKQYRLSFVLKKGDMILLKKNKDEDITELDRKNLSERLYKIAGFETHGKIVQLIKHISTQPFVQSKAKAFTGDFKEQIRCGINTLNFLVRGIDFELTADGNITFKKH